MTFNINCLECVYIYKLLIEKNCIAINYNLIFIKFGWYKEF